MEQIFIGIVILISVFYLYRKFKRDIKKGQCVSCPLYEKCDSKDKFS